MVELRVEVENLTMDYEHTLLKLPCSLLEHISKDCEYVIVSAQSTDYGDIQVGIDDVYYTEDLLVCGRNFYHSIYAFENTVPSCAEIIRLP